MDIKCPGSLEELDQLEQLIPLCRKELYEQVKGRIERGTAKSISDAARQLGAETAKNPESIRRAIRREDEGGTLSHLAHYAQGK